MIAVFGGQGTQPWSSALGAQPWEAQASLPALSAYCIRFLAYRQAGKDACAPRGCAPRPALTRQGKLVDAALGAARQWEFEPSTFEGHAVQVIETISFPAK